MIAMVFIILMTSATTYFVTVDQLREGSSTGPTTVMMAAPVIDRGDTNGTTWDVTSEVDTISRDNGIVRWADVMVDVRGPWGAPLLPPTRPIPYNLSMDMGTPTNTVVAWFIEGPGDIGRLDVGDSVRVTGMTQLFEGGLLEITSGTALVGYAALPWGFDIHSRTVMEFLAPKVMESRWGGRASWNVSVEIRAVSPHGKHVPWEELRIDLNATSCCGHRVLLRAAPLIASGPWRFMDTSLTSPRAWYMDAAGTPTYVTEGNIIVLTGLPLAEYYPFELFWRGQSVGRVMVCSGEQVLG